MGLTYAKITLVNSIDAGMARRGKIKKKEVREVKVSALVDSWAYMLTISDLINDQLGLDVRETLEVELADGTHQKCDIAGPVDLHFKNRRTACDALVLPGATEVLFGAIPLEGLDVVLDPKTQQLDVHPLRPYIAGTKVK